MIPSAGELYRAAQILVKQGQPVFPCRSSGPKVKAPMTRNGLHDATLDLDQIKAWWRTHRTAALGIPTGIVWDVLDVDVKRAATEVGDGRRHLPYLARVGLLEGCQFVVRTPSGGWHLYFKAAPKGSLGNRANATLGLDVRSHGGYVIAPPSYIDATETDAPYAGAYEHMGATTGGNDDPLNWDLIVSALAPVNTETKKPVPVPDRVDHGSVATLRHWLSQRQAGERNNALHWAVCRCIDNGIDPMELVEVAIHLGLDEDEIMLTINSALRRSGVDRTTLKSEAETLFQ